MISYSKHGETIHFYRDPVRRVIRISIFFISRRDVEAFHMKRLAPHQPWEKQANQQPGGATALRPPGPEEAAVSREWGRWALLFDSHSLSLLPWASYFSGPIKEG